MLTVLTLFLLLTQTNSPSQILRESTGRHFSRVGLQHGCLDWALLDSTTWPLFFVDLVRRFERIRLR